MFSRQLLGNAIRVPKKSIFVSNQMSGPVEHALREKLTNMLQPTVLEITNDSWQHRHHSAMLGSANTETHFSIRVVSDEFSGKTTMQRHRLIYKALAEELDNGLHSLSLKTWTSDESIRLSEESSNL